MKNLILALGLVYFSSLASCNRKYDEVYIRQLQEQSNSTFSSNQSFDSQATSNNTSPVKAENLADSQATSSNTSPVKAENLADSQAASNKTSINGTIINYVNNTASSNDTNDLSSGASFASGFTQSFLLIFMAEIGDKTFILVMIYAAKFRWWKVLLLASLAMSFMHCLSCGLGQIFVTFIPKLWTRIIAIALFWLMGIHAIYSGVKEYRTRCIRKRQGKRETDTSESDERAEIEEIIAEHEQEVAGATAQVKPEDENKNDSPQKQEIPDETEKVNVDKENQLQIKEEEIKQRSSFLPPISPPKRLVQNQESDSSTRQLIQTSQNPSDQPFDSNRPDQEKIAVDSGTVAEEEKKEGEKEDEEKKEEPKKKKKTCFKCKNPYLFFMALLMCSEWGDRSQIAAIALTPNYGVGSVILGGCIGHILTIIIALLLGKIIERFIKERLLNIIGGLLFVGFGIWELFFGILYEDYFQDR